jgi:hypothetical protein
MQLSVTRKAKRLVVLIVLTAIALMLVPGGVGAVGLGVSPPQIDIKNALRGTTYEEQITVFNPDETTNTYGLDTTEEIASWVSYSLPDNPKIPVHSVSIPAKSNRAVIANIAIPGDTPNGLYSAQLLVTVLPPGAEGEQTGVGVGMQIPITLNIDVTGTQLIAGKVNDISTQDAETGYPLTIKVAFVNTGNVTAAPLIETDITYKGEKVDSFSHNSTKVSSGNAQLIQADWDTTGKAPADYLAKTKVTLDGKILMEKELTFKILPLGTLTRAGELKELSYDGNGIRGYVVKVMAVFANKGQIETFAEFNGEVYFGGNLIEAISSEKLLVKQYQEATLVAYFNPAEPGTYTVKGHITYEGKQTDTKEITYKAEALHDITKPPETTEAQTQAGNSKTWLYVAIGVVAVIVIAVVVVLLIRRRRYA